MKYNTIQLAHGGGGWLSRELVRDEIVPRFGNSILNSLPDSASLDIEGAGLIFTTDSYVVSPIEFPGGNIGNLAVHGTVNDISVSGGEPLFLSLALILEEGLDIAKLSRVLDAIKKSVDECGVKIVTGDTKVVGSGQCDCIFINTSGIGRKIKGFQLGTDKIRDGDSIIVSGSIGDHGMAIIAARSNIGITNGPVTDSAPVNRMVMALSALAPDISFMRDPTRGGLSAVLNESIDGKALDVVISEKAIPFSQKSRAVAEMLGVDLLQSACEGRFIIFCRQSIENAVLEILRGFENGKNVACIGRVKATNSTQGKVILDAATGGRRVIDLPRGEMLPRIC